MEELECITVGSLLNQLKPNPFSSWSCSEEITKQLDKLDKSTTVKVYGSCSFRLADEYPSYYISLVVEVK